jgi:hypothetical protein
LQRRHALASMLQLNIKTYEISRINWIYTNE